MTIFDELARDAMNAALRFDDDAPSTRYECISILRSLDQLDPELALRIDYATTDSDDFDALIHSMLSIDLTD